MTTKKKIKNKVARIIRKNTGYKLPLSMKVAKQFLNKEYCNENKVNDCFEFDWEWDGYENEYNIWQSSLYIWDKKKNDINFYNSWSVPIELYELQELYNSK